MPCLPVFFHRNEKMTKNSDKNCKLVTSTSSARYAIGWVARSHARAARERRRECEGWGKKGDLTVIFYEPTFPSQKPPNKTMTQNKKCVRPFQSPSSAKCASYANVLAISPFLPPLEVWSLYSAGHGIWTGPRKRRQRQRIHYWHWCFWINSMFRTAVHDRFELPRVKLQ